MNTRLNMDEYKILYNDRIEKYFNALEEMSNYAVGTTSHNKALYKKNLIAAYNRGMDSIRDIIYRNEKQKK